MPGYGATGSRSRVFVAKLPEALAKNYGKEKRARLEFSYNEKEMEADPEAGGKGGSAAQHSAQGQKVFNE